MTANSSARWGIVDIVRKSPVDTRKVAQTERMNSALDWDSIAALYGL
jgi:hypothetical protein